MQVHHGIGGHETLRGLCGRGCGYVERLYAIGAPRDLLTYIGRTWESGPCSEIGRQEVENIVGWRRVYRACTNLEAVHLTRNGRSVADLHVLSLMCTKIVSLTLDDLDNLMEAGDQLLSVLSAGSTLKEIELIIWRLVPEELLCKFFECLKSVTTLACTMCLPEVGPTRTSLMFWPVI